jgi:hypothetical protein
MAFGRPVAKWATSGTSSSEDGRSSSLGSLRITKSLTQKPSLINITLKAEFPLLHFFYCA